MTARRRPRAEPLGVWFIVVDGPHRGLVGEIPYAAPHVVYRDEPYYRDSCHGGVWRYRWGI